MSVSDREQKRAWLVLLVSSALLAAGVMVYFDYNTRKGDAAIFELMHRQEEARQRELTRDKDGSIRAVRRPIRWASAPSLETAGPDGGVDK